MGVQLYGDSGLVYDSRLDAYKLLKLQTTTGVNKAGTATFTMPPGHPAYRSFTSYKTVVTLYDNGALRFRGRALYPEDDFYNCRTITCEGERGFFRDYIIRPYLYQDSPANIFADALALYNAEADEFKRFTLGEVTVTDANEYIRLESSTAETFAEFFDKLVERCGGYITFSDDENGGRAVNWLAEIGTACNQPVEFGENLLEFARSGQTPDLATAILPYGAQLEDGTRVTIASVNDGKDWVKDDTAVALRGLIIATQTWDDVTEPANLLTKAREWLAEHKLAVTSLQLSAADLSRLNRSLDTYKDGDRVKVHSAPHDVDDWFQLTDRAIDWLDPAGGGISLGKTQTSLTGADVEGDKKGSSELHKVKQEIVTDYKNGIANAVEETTRLLSSKIEQTSDSILLTVSDIYATSADLDALGEEVTELDKDVVYTQSRIEQLADSIKLEVSGSLGGTASIVMEVDGVKSSYEMDLSEIRKAFANDTTAVTISAGVITFNSNTLVVNSTNFKVDAAGNITATNADITGVVKATSGRIGAAGTGWTIDENSLYYGDTFSTATAFLCTGSGASMTIAGHTGTGWVFKAGSKFGVTKNGELYCTSANLSGTLTTENGSHSAKITSGGMHLYYEGELCGTINSRYHANAEAHGVTICADGDGQYIVFMRQLENAGGAYEIAYLIDNGFFGYDEVNIFPVSTRFLGKTYLASYTYALGLYLYEDYFVKSCDSSGEVLEEMLGYRDGALYVGSNYANTVLRGTTVYLKNTSTTVTSDRDAKNSIEELPDEYEAFFDALQPVRFKYNEGTSGRYHVGFIAQDVETALTTAGLDSMDFAGYVNIGFTGELGLAYDEFIALQHLKIKRLEQRIAALEQR